VDISDAYQHCEQVVRTKARNFSYGLRLLPPPKRRALSAVYALARRIDDIADGGGPVEQRLAHLSAARTALCAPWSSPGVCRAWHAMVRSRIPDVFRAWRDTIRSRRPHACCATVQSRRPDAFRA
jgi:phytoene synthase